MSGSDSAFPGVCSSSGDNLTDPVNSVWSEGGLTKREYFAGLAMQGLLVNNRVTYKREFCAEELETLCSDSLACADALLAALAEKGRKP